jgi:outer membrane receptor for ferrienterochelin and colicin
MSETTIGRSLVKHLRTSVVARVALLAIGSLLARGALAQVPTATLGGRASADGQPLPGVTVAIKSPSLQGVRAAVTTVTGDYTFVNLPPGDYSVTFKLDGFQTQSRTIRLSASQASQIDVVLRLEGMAAETTVVGKTEQVSQSSTGAATFTEDFIAKLPTSRTISEAVRLAPGVNANAPFGVSISGGQSIENLYTVNGVVIQDNVKGTLLDLYIEDAVLETTTLTSGVSAEYGRFTGGVINTVTRSGGNTFSGSLRLSFANDTWRSTSAYRTSSGANPQEGTFVQKLLPTWEATLGGPIVQDRLWFFLAGRLNDSEQAKLTYLTNVPYSYDTSEKRYEVKLTASPFQGQTVTASYTGITRHEDNYNAVRAYDLDTLTSQGLPQTLLAINYNGVLSPSFFLDAQYSRRKASTEGLGGQSADFVGGTPLMDVTGATMNTSVYCGYCAPKERNNDNYVVKGTGFFSTPSLGSHNVVLGYDDFGGQRKENQYQSGSNFVLFAFASPIVRGPSVYPVIDVGGAAELDWLPILATSEGSDIRTRSVYLNDTWRASNRLSFNLGVRYDKNHAVDPLGAVTSNDSAWSPRLAATWDATGDAKLKVTASYAKYVTALQDSQATGGSLGGNYADFWWYYDGNGATPINTDPTKPLLSAHDAMGAIQNWFGGAGCLPDPTAASCKIPLAAARINGVNVQLLGSLASPYADEIVFGLSGSLGPSGTFRADFVRRAFGNFYDLHRDLSTGRVTDAVGNRYDLGLIEISNDYRREYTGLHTQFMLRTSERLSLGGSWTWSHLLGNAVGESTSAAGSAQLNAHNYPEYKEARWNTPVGSLYGDTRHRVRLTAVYDLPVPARYGAVNVGLLQAWDTGNPYGARGNVDTRAYVTNPGYLTPPAATAGSDQTYWYTARDAFRTEDVFSTDLSLNYSYRFGAKVEVFVSPQILNLFNSQHVISVDQTVENAANQSKYYAKFNPFTTVPVQGPRGTGANWTTGPLFGQPTGPTSYQAPRTFRISAGVRF